ncbi:MAG: Type secretion system rane fusion protein PrsE [Pseudomonadota bacterium]|jgi:multidrug efflux pump subunit AcrA (membrane-fusion protein)
MATQVSKGFWVIGLLLVGFAAWATVVPLDSGVPSTGIVSVDGRRRVVQHQTGGVIKKILIKEGAEVGQGELLVKLEDSAEVAMRSQIVADLRATRLKIDALERLLPGLQAIAEDGFYPRNQIIELERTLLEAEAHELGLVDRLAAADQALQRTEIRAPIQGRVMGVEVNTPGAMVLPGVKIMEIVPPEDQIIVEARIRPHLIDKVTPGTSAQVRFTALQMANTPIIFGKVDWISPDRFEEPDRSVYPEGYYLARVSVAPEAVNEIMGFRAIPGMPAEVMIKTGERTFFQYLVKPISDRFARAVKEY